MLQRATSGSVVCPTCGRLVGVREAQCSNCGRWNPGLWGYAPALGRFAAVLSTTHLIFAGCVAFFGISLALDLRGVSMDFPFGLLGPSTEAAVRMGSSGYLPIVGMGRWWTPLSAGWLHGGALHIAFNLYYLSWLLPTTEKIFGPGRTLILYVVSSVIGFVVTSIVGLLVALGPLGFLGSFFRGALAGAPLTLGASAALCGLLGALLYYGQASGQTLMTQRIWQSAIFLLIFGFVIGAIDNWAHIGGFAGGWLVAKLLRPLEDESPLHWIAGLLCLLAMGAAVIVSLLTPIPPGFFR